VLLGSARELIEEWFESEPLRGTLATDAVIGAFAPPSAPGTGYVLFHHVMGSLGGARGVWAYVRGGMGALCESIATVARASGVEIRCDAPARAIQVDGDRVRGVLLESGEALEADFVVSSLDPARSLSLLSSQSALPDPYRRALATIDYRSPVFKMNLALRELPRFRTRDRESIPLSGTIHVGAQDLDAIELAYREASLGLVPQCPLVELTLPSAVDDTIAPPGRHLASIFAQYAPALDLGDLRWPALREEFERRVLDAVEQMAPGFRDSIEHCESLAPPDLEAVFGLTGGNIFHGAMTPDRLWFLRPVPGWARYETPLRGLYLCGSGTHPGGGVMGAPGRNAARVIARTERLSRG
jgi:phytoene dehydrogenase-like protein